MKSTVKTMFFGFMLTVLGSGFAWAQATAEISGRVTDPTGAVLPGVEVTATQTGTGLVRTTVTNETGSYVLANLPLGPYRVEAALPGFRTFVRTGVVLQIGSSPAVNAVLEVGDVSQTIEVEAAAALVDTRNSGVSQVMENQRILELPLEGRNVGALIELSGGAVQISGPESGARTFGGAPIVAMAGGWGLGTRFLLDGNVHNDVYSGQGLPLPFPDALAEFTVSTGGLSAENRSSSVGSVTSSGTNEYHGSLFNFVRNDLFNAREFFATDRSTLKRNQFGGTVGGPIARNRLFFLGGYQGTIVRQDPADVREFVPTAAMLAGDWTDFASPACNAGRPANLRAPFENNRIDPALYDPAALALAAKLPKTADPCGEITFGNRETEHRGQAIGRVDYQLSDAHSLFGRVLIDFTDTTDGFENNPDNLLLSSQRPGRDDLGQFYTFGSTYLIGPDTVNAFRLSVNRTVGWRKERRFFDASSLGINVTPQIPGWMSLSVDSGFSVGGGRTRVEGGIKNTSYHLSNNLSLVRGSHQISIGGSVEQGRAHTIASDPDSFSHNGERFGLGMADFLLGRPSEFSQANPNTLNAKKWLAALYVQDSWRVRPTLTLNFGLRWEPNITQEYMDGVIYGFDVERFRQGIKSTVFPNAPAGLLYPGDPGFPEDGFNNQWWKFAPRAGFAWDVQGDGRTSVRASYALSRENLPMFWTANQAQSPPFGFAVGVRSPEGGLRDPWRGIPGGDPFPVTDISTVPFPVGGENYSAGPPDLKMPTVQSWNLSIQREIAEGWLVSTSYMGSLSTNLLTVNAINPAIFIPGRFDAGGNCTLDGKIVLTGGRPGSACSTTRNTNDRRRLTLERPEDGQFLASFGQFDPGGTQPYHGLLVSVRRRAAQGLNINANYTWSHCITDAHIRPDGTSLGGTRVGTDPNNRRADRGNCPVDRRHVLNLTAVAETPQFVNPALRAIATGWRLAGIYRVASGQPINVDMRRDIALNGITNRENRQRPNQVLEDPYDNRSGRPGTRFLNPAAFSPPETGATGNLGRNAIRGLKTWSFDLALSRVFPFGESQRLEVRAEAFNVTNSFRGTDPNTDIFNRNFGLIRNSQAPRIMQFALKYLF